MDTELVHPDLDRVGSILARVLGRTYGDPPPDDQPATCTTWEQRLKLLEDRARRGKSLWHPGDELLMVDVDPVAQEAAGPRPSRRKTG